MPIKPIAYRLFLALFCLGLAVGAQAHPHNWVDISTELRFNAHGLITGIKHRWLFDDYYSVYLTQNMDENRDGMLDENEQDILIGTVLGNLKKYRYFTQVEQGDKQVKLQAPSEQTTGLREHRLELGFYLPFAQPINPSKAALVYRIFDPGYYIEMVHAESDSAITLRGAPEACRHRMEKARPDPKVVAYAASLGVDESGGNSLGIQFAEKVIVQCP
jgi:ABC-type uncharacterized transport system substrate-binding protein